jgi:hypothetical protein
LPFFPSRPSMSISTKNPLQYWCWINPDDGFLAERITGEYLWLWITLFVSCLLYGTSWRICTFIIVAYAFRTLSVVPMFFLTRGNITLDKDHWWRFKSHPPKEGYVASSIGMLAYVLCAAHPSQSQLTYTMWDIQLPDCVRPHYPPAECRSVVRLHSPCPRCRYLRRLLSLWTERPLQRPTPLCPP